MRVSFLIFIITFITLLPSYAQQTKPNIVFILADDLGYKDLGCYGNPFNETPNIDSLARSGMLFTQAYASSPVCSPSRAGFLTGKHPARLKITNFLGGERKDTASPVLPAEWTRYLSPREITIPEILGRNSYRCGMVGKWHLGGADSLGPAAQGFHYERTIGKNGLDYYNYTITEKNKVVFEDKGTTYLTDKLTDYGVEFIQKNKDQPFFLYMAYSAPHVLLVPRADKLRKYYFKYPKYEGKFDANYAAMIESLDEGVGKLIKTLRENGLDKNTIIIFTSDNGGVGLPELGPRPTTVDPLRAWKGHVYEGGIRVPLIISWSGRIKSSQENQHPVTNLDFMPTFIELCQVREKPQMPDGKSFMPILFDATNKYTRGELFWHYPHFSNQEGRPSGAMRSGDFKLVENYETGKIELYNIREDIEEKNDLAGSSPQTLKKLLALWRKWQLDVAANMPLPNSEHRR